jgi:hypothetical protein
MKSRPPRAALGFRVKSGWATAILLAGANQAPRVLDRRVVDLSDPDIPESRQPFHATLGLHEAADEKEAARLKKTVKRCTNNAVKRLLEDYRNRGQDLCGAGLVVGSDIDPAKIKQIKNAHIRVHAQEGRLFRDVLEAALRTNGLNCIVIVERQMYDLATARLRRPEDELRRSLADLGRAVGGSWRTEEKMAALAAWLVLAKVTMPAEILTTDVPGIRNKLSGTQNWTGT